MANNINQQNQLSRVWVCRMILDGQCLVRIDIPDIDASYQLLNALRYLVHHSDVVIRLDQIFPVVYTNMRYLELGVAEGTDIFEKSIYAIDDGFKWMPTVSGWQENIRLLIGQIKGGSGHHYYGGEYDDDAQIEISLCEKRNEMMIEEILASGI